MLHLVGQRREEDGSDQLLPPVLSMKVILDLSLKSPLAAAVIVAGCICQAVQWSLCEMRQLMR